MFQPIQIETQSEQQCLPHLHGQGSTWGACREFPFDGRDPRLWAGKYFSNYPATATDSCTLCREIP